MKPSTRSFKITGKGRRFVTPLCPLCEGELNRVDLYLLKANTLVQCQKCEEAFNSIEGTVRKEYSFFSFSFQALKIPRNRRKVSTF